MNTCAQVEEGLASVERKLQILVEEVRNLSELVKSMTQSRGSHAPVVQANPDPVTPVMASVTAIRTRVPAPHSSPAIPAPRSVSVDITPAPVAAAPSTAYRGQIEESAMRNLAKGMADAHRVWYRECTPDILWQGFIQAFGPQSEDLKKKSKVKFTNSRRYTLTDEERRQIPARYLSDDAKTTQICRWFVELMQTYSRVKPISIPEPVTPMAPPQDISVGFAEAPQVEDPPIEIAVEKAPATSTHELTPEEQVRYGHEMPVNLVRELIEQGRGGPEHSVLVHKAAMHRLDGPLDLRRLRFNSSSLFRYASTLLELKVKPKQAAHTVTTATYVLLVRLLSSDRFGEEVDSLFFEAMAYAAGHDGFTELDSLVNASDPKATQLLVQAIAGRRVDLDTLLPHVIGVIRTVLCNVPVTMPVPEFNGQVGRLMFRTCSVSSFGEKLLSLALEHVVLGGPSVDMFAAILLLGFGSPVLRDVPVPDQSVGELRAFEDAINRAPPTGLGRRARGGELPRSKKSKQ